MFLLLLPNAEASETIVLNDPLEDYFLSENKVDILKDSDHKLTIKSILSPENDTLFKSLRTTFPENEDPGASYWIRFKLRNQRPDINWLLECYNIQVNQLEFYTVNEDGSYIIQKTGADHHFDDRTFNHINFEFLLSNLDQREKTYYVRFILKSGDKMRFLIRSYSRFTNYAFNEYYLLGTFYGMIIIIALYNLFLYPRLKDSAYLYYGIYAVFVGLFSMAQDGIGFQYFWPSLPRFNDYAPFLFSSLMVIFMLLYTRSFLETKINYPILNNLIIGFIILKASIIIINFISPEGSKNLIWIDLLPFILAYITAIVSYENNNRSSLYFVIGFTILFLAFLINTLRIFKVIPANVITVYSINVAVIIEMILLSQALTERVKKIRENELMKENLNKELEQKVKEKTEALLMQKNIIEEKAKALDTFIYKASHDIKGPLKSLIGVATLGMKDTSDYAPIYFKHVLKTARKLDAIVKDLLHITNVNNLNIEISEINFKETIIDILESCNRIPGYESINFEIDIEQDGKFSSEKMLISSIIQNIIENGIKFRNREASVNKLKITVKSNDKMCQLKFVDNGIGIEKEYHEKIFEMFFRIQDGHDESTGLGLYIVKLAVEKLGGQIHLKSVQGEGTTFKITLPNQISYAKELVIQ
jgi:hypothetical protein